MDRAGLWLPRSQSNSTSSQASIAAGLPTDTKKDDDEKHSYLLPLPVYQQPKIRVRTLLSHCLYRRVLIWSVATLFLVCLVLSIHSIDSSRSTILQLVDVNKPEDTTGSTTTSDRTGLSSDASGAEDSDSKSDEPNDDGDGDSDDDDDNNDDDDDDNDNTRLHWLKYRHLDGYFNGLKALVPVANHTPEFPRKTADSPFPLTITYTSAPTPTPFIPQPDYSSSKYTDEYHEVRKCYLDKKKKVPVPDLYAYNGVVQGMPDPVIGSHKVLGLRDDVCFDRFGRYGPYGLGYSLDQGGVGEGHDTEKSGSDVVWSKTGQIDYNKVDWGSAQDWCFEANKHRFVSDSEDAFNPPGDSSLFTSSYFLDENRKVSRNANKEQSATRDNRKKLERIAVVVRSYVGFQWTQHAILNFRAMISELALRSGGEYAVHFLLHVRNDDEPIWADAETAQRLLDDNVPAEFHSICTLWSEAQMRLLYPGQFGTSVANPSNGDIHGVYRSAHMPLQHFALIHPQYAHFWNWEMDMRWLGNYYELFDRLGSWARGQSRVEAWERAERYYIPPYHGSWENFTRTVREQSASGGRKAIMGPVQFPGRKSVRHEERGKSFLPSSCQRGQDKDANRCGVGEDSDLVTLNPIFDAEDSGWVFASDVTGYESRHPTPPRRCAIVTASRLSRRLLAVMHEETWRLHHGMFSEMFPASMAFHHGMKAVYAPHPVLLDRSWDVSAVDWAFNGGRDRSTSSHGSPFDFTREHNHKGTSWYYNSEFAGLLWRRWLGYGQMDGRGNVGGEGTLRGGRKDEEEPRSSGRLCLRSMLVHPIKYEHPDEME